MARKKLNKESSAADGPAPNSDKTNRFAIDQLIRSRGFRVWKRPERSDVLWELKGIVYSQREVLEWLAETFKGSVEDARYVEMLFREGYER